LLSDFPNQNIADAEFRQAHSNANKAYEGAVETKIGRREMADNNEGKEKAASLAITLSESNEIVFFVIRNRLESEPADPILIPTQHPKIQEPD
jgi:site-specific recombinase XerC